MPEKKSFKGTNPALSFIRSVNAGGDTQADASVYMHTDTQTHLPSTPDPHGFSLDHTKNTHAHAYTHSKPRNERKSRRLQLLIRPSTHAEISALAAESDTSVNDIINTILEYYLQKGDR